MQPNGQIFLELRRPSYMSHNDVWELQFASANSAFVDIKQTGIARARAKSAPLQALPSSGVSLKSLRRQTKRYRRHFIQHAEVRKTPEVIQLMGIEVRQDHNIHKLFAFPSEGSFLGRLHVREAPALIRDEGCPFERLLEMARFWTKIEECVRLRESNPMMPFTECCSQKHPHTSKHTCVHETPPSSKGLLFQINY